MGTTVTDAGLILEQLARVLSSDGFRRAERSSALLRYIVEQTVNGRADRLKEYTLGAEALGRGDSFDPRTDPIVRAEASRLRARLERYYETEGANDPLILLLPKGTYVPSFSLRPLPEGAAAAEPEPPAEGTPPRRPRLTPTALVLTSGLVVIAAVATFWWGRSSAPATAPRPFLLLDVDLRSEGVIGSEVGADMALSPDGTRLVFVTRDAGGLTRLNTRRLDRPDAVRLPDTEGARSPFISGRGGGGRRRGRTPRLLRRERAGAGGYLRVRARPAILRARKWRVDRERGFILSCGHRHPNHPCVTLPRKKRPFVQTSTGEGVI
jgi:hypothetical protein